MTKYILLFLSLTLMGALGGYCFKKVTLGNCSTIFKVLKNKFLYIGGMLYLASAVLNIIVLKSLPYTIVLPLTSITYIWTMIISYYLLNEKITKGKITGVIFIIIGSIFIGVSASL